MTEGVPVAGTVEALRRVVGGFRAAGETVALVPTMGALHAGHLALVQQARQQARRVVVSIFVNPTQFAPNEDFSTYPRTFDSDLAALAAEQTDLVWAPESVTAMYPERFATKVVPEGPASVGLEDAFRPHFFTGVATVVSKLLIQCLPDVALFGEKDYQQLRVVTRMARDLDLPVTILGVPTMREADGLAMSSRNVYLAAAERAVAPMLHRVLGDSAARIAAGEEIDAALRDGRRAIAQAGFQLDYLEGRHAETLQAITSPREGPVRLLVAARLGKTRLIDNVGVPPT
jgi:pantoate--beta-alanine ligase